MIESGWGGGGACILRKRQNTENTEEFCVLLIEGWSFFSPPGTHIFSDVYSCVSEKQKGYDGQYRYMIGQNYCMDEICLVKVHVAQPL